MTTRPLTAAHRALAEAHLDLAHHAVAAALKHTPSLNRDDILGAAYEGLCAAARDWRPELDANFERYGWFRCMHAIQDELRGLAWFGRRAWENGALAPLPLLDRDDFLDDGDDVEALAVHAHLCGHVARTVATLRPSLQQVYTRVYIDGERMKDVGAEMGLTESRISQLCRQLTAELRGVIGAAA